MRWDLSSDRYDLPLAQAVIEEGPSGRLDVTFRRSEFSDEQLLARFPVARKALAAPSSSPGEMERRTAVIEAVLPTTSGYAYVALCERDTGACLVTEQGFGAAVKERLAANSDALFARYFPEAGAGSPEGSAPRVLVGNVREGFRALAGGTPANGMERAA